MITLLKINKFTKEIDGWFMAANFSDAASKASAAGEPQLASYCYSNEWFLDQRKEARFNMPVNEGGSFIYTVLQ